MNKQIRVMVVDHDQTIVNTLVEILNKEDDISVVGQTTGVGGFFDMAKKLKPDVIVMDYSIPKEEGCSIVTDLVSKIEPEPSIIVISDISDDSIDMSFKCLSSGAVDFVVRSIDDGHLDVNCVKKDLVGKIRIAKYAKSTKKNIELSNKNVQIRNLKPELVVIGSSTGGPPVLEYILKHIPEGMDSTILIVQHMPKNFTNSLSKRLDSLTEIKVKEAQEGEFVFPGVCYIAPGDWHMTVKVNEEKRKFIHLTKASQINGFRPSIDVTMNSVAPIYRNKVLGIILTGMGRDGAEGMTEIKIAGGHTIVQSPESAIIRSMPEEVINARSAEYIMNPEEIADTLKKITRANNCN